MRNMRNVYVIYSKTGDRPLFYGMKSRKKFLNVSLRKIFNS